MAVETNQKWGRVGDELARLHNIITGKNMTKQEIIKKRMDSIGSFEDIAKRLCGKQREA